MMSPRKCPQPAASLLIPSPRPVTPGPWRRPGCPVQSGWHEVRAGGGSPLPTTSLGKQASREGVEEAGSPVLGGFPTRCTLPSSRDGSSCLVGSAWGGRGSPGAGQVPLSRSPHPRGPAFAFCFPSFPPLLLPPVRLSPHLRPILGRDARGPQEASREELG